jgi:hypothetical protein
MNPIGLIGAGGGAVALMLADITTKYIGVPMPVVIAAVIGALAGIALGDPIEPRKKLFTHAFAYTVLGAVTTVLLPLAMGWKLDPAPQACLAVAASSLMRWVWPAITERVKSIIANLNLTRKE